MGIHISPHLTHAGRVAPKRREHLLLVELESAPLHGFSPPSQILVTDPNLPAEFTIRFSVHVTLSLASATCFFLESVSISS